MENFNAPAPPVVNELGPDSEPLPPLLLQRPMVLFKTATGLKPGSRAAPHADFLFWVLSDHHGHQAWLRSFLGDHYKNFENLVAGRGSTGTTKKLIAARARLTPETMLALVQALSGSISEGEPGATHDLLPGIPRIVMALADLPFQLHRAFIAEGHQCPHCGADVLQDVDQWWLQQSAMGEARVDLGPNEYWFVERLLTSLFVSVGRPAEAARNSPDGLLSRLTEPTKHPVGHWLDMVQEAHDASNFPDLVARLPSTGGSTDQSMAKRLRKWSCGSGDLMPVHRGQQLIEALSEQKRARLGEKLKLGMLTARGVAFVIDFIQAAASQSAVTRERAQRLIEYRLQQIAQNQRIANGGARTAKVDVPPGQCRDDAPSPPGR